MNRLCGHGSLFSNFIVRALATLLGVKNGILKLLSTLLLMHTGFVALNSNVLLNL
jgi:hypothetical protein